MKQIRLFLAYYWRPILTIGGALLIVIGLLWFRLGELPGGISQTEAVTREHLLRRDVDFGTILANPLYLPHSLALYILQAFGIASLGALRSISAFVGLLMLIAFYLLLRRWHTARMAILGTTLLATSSWFLHTARYGSTDILFTVLIIFLFVGVWLQHSRHRAILLSILLFSAVMTLYIPGMIWFVILGGLWQHRRILAEFQRVPAWFIVLWLVFGTLLIAPLIWSLSQNPALLRPLLGLPEQFPPLTSILKNIATIPVRLFVRGPDDPALWLGRLPLLDFFSSVMLIVGVYWYTVRWRLDRSRFMFLAFFLGTLLLAIQGPVNLIFFLPFVYLLITAGLTFMLQQWFTVFPRNPIARTIGTTLITIGVLVASFYHINHYYIAWPNTPETRAAYHLRP
jgi:hypothetical protein